MANDVATFSPPGVDELESEFTPPAPHDFIPPGPDEFHGVEATNNLPSLQPLTSQDNADQTLTPPPRQNIGEAQIAATPLPAGMQPFTPEEASQANRQAWKAFQEPQIHLPKLEIKPDDNSFVAAGKEAVNLATSIPEFASSPMGMVAAGAGTVAPTLTAAAFTVDMLHSLGKQIRDAYQNWDQFTPAQKGVAVADILGTGGLAALTGHATVKGAGAAALEYVPRGAGIGSAAVLPIVAQPNQREQSTDTFLNRVPRGTGIGGFPPVERFSESGETFNPLPSPEQTAIEVPAASKPRLSLAEKVAALPSEEGTPKMAETGGMATLEYSDSDLARYKQLTGKMADLTSAGEIGTPEYFETWRDWEKIRNKYNGMPPKQLESEIRARNAESDQRQLEKQKEVIPNEETQGQTEGVLNQTAAAGIGPGGTLPTDVGTKAQIEQLTGAFKGVATDKPELTERVKQAFDIGATKDAAKGAVQRTLDGIKGAAQYVTGLWNGIDKIDDITRAKGLLSEELETRGWRLRQAKKQFESSVPDKRVRDAISKWIDTGGDEALLRNQAVTVPGDKRAAYERALALTPDEKLAATHIKNYFESRLKEAQDAGVLEDGIEDYIHRIYKRDTPWKKDVIGQIQSGVLNTRTPGLALKRVFEYDAQAEAAGYNVVSDFVPRILDYEASLSKAIASRAAVKRFSEIKMSDGRPMVDVGGLGTPVPSEGVREATLIKPSFKPGEEGKLNNRKDYVARNYPALRKWKWASVDESGKPIFVQGDVLIHPDAAARVDALLKPSAIRTSQSIPAKVARGALEAGSVFKQTMLDFSGFHQTQIGVHSMEHGVNPFSPIKDIDFENPDVVGLLRGGVTLGGDGTGRHVREGLVGSSLSRKIPGLGPLMESYHDWLFQEYIPRIKMSMALNALERNRARFKDELASGKMSEEALNRVTANQANAAFGEQNYIMLERSKTSQDLARLILLAPDFLESRGRFAGQAFTKQGSEQRMALLLGALTMYVTARLLNKGIDDQWHFEPENLFSVVYKGHSYGLRTVQGDILHLLEEPTRFWLHRLHPLTTKPVMQLLTHRDEFGRQRTAWQTLGDTIKNIIPISMRNSREQKLWESMLNAFGVTERRYNEVSNVYRLASEWRKKNNIAPELGEFIYNPDKDVYRPIRLALLEHDVQGAKTEIRKAVESGVVTRQKLNEHFRNYLRSPFSGSRRNEKAFYQSLNPDQKKTYEAALEEKRRIRETYNEAAR